MFSGLTPPSISILRGESLTGISSFISTAYNRPETSEHVSSASKPLLSETSLDKEVLSSTLPVKFSASTHSKFSISESLPPQKQCSFAQAVFNGKTVHSGLLYLLSLSPCPNQINFQSVKDSSYENLHKKQDI